MSDIEKYISDLSVWRGETIQTLKKLNRNQDNLDNRIRDISNCITNMKVSYENRLTVLETKFKIISVASLIALGGLVTLIVEMIIKAI